MMWVTKSTKLSDFAAVVYCEMSPPASEETSIPAPGFVTLATTSPIASASVVTTSK